MSHHFKKKEPPTECVVKRPSDSSNVMSHELNSEILGVDCLYNFITFSPEKPLDVSPGAGRVPKPGVVS
jgi:hypothetical protein